MRSGRTAMGAAAILPLLVASCYGPADEPYVRAGLGPAASAAGAVEVPDHVFAFYNGDNLLIADALAEVAARVNEAPEPYTDVYVVSHGWNFTLPEAIANYGTYLRAVANVLCEAEPGAPPLRPLLVLVSWSSVTRPVGEAGVSLLPFGLDESIAAAASIADTLAFHIPSAWKQSLHAASNALGRRYPDHYLGEAPMVAQRISRSAGGGSPGLDLPVSALLYQLFDWNRDGYLGSGKPVRIHAVGHSYGAKLMFLASMEALRRTEYVLKEADGTLDSLVLFNAAFHPSEARYRSCSCAATPLLEREPEELLRHIPRKAFVYSNTDFATGLTFELSQIPMNNFHAQIGQQAANQIIEDMRGEAWARPLIAPTMLAAGALQFGYSSIVGASIWAWRRLWNTPQDLAHHLLCADFASSWPAPMRYPARLVHFFAPLDTLWGGAADQRGLFRHTSQALGRSGLYRHAVGRPNGLATGSDRYPSYANVKPLEAFVDPGSDLPPSIYDGLAARLLPPAASPYADPARFYSFDASDVLAGASPFVGGHGALRSTEEIRIAAPGGDVSTRVIDSTVRFVLNFSHGTVR